MEKTVLQMTISIIHPSRQRPAKARATYDYWMKNASGQIDIQYILSVDDDDDQNAYAVAFAQTKVTMVADANRNLVEATNAGAKLATGDILVLVSDDFECPEFWDVLLYEAFKDVTKPRILKVYDGIQKYIVTIPIMNRAYYELRGYIYHPGFTHMFCDLHMAHLADVTGCIIWRNDLVFPHKHYSIGACEKDAISEKADSTWAQGEAFYISEVKSRFGLPADVDIFAFNEIGMGQMQHWLRDKGLMAL